MGTVKDEEKALKTYEDLAGKGHPLAQVLSFSRRNSLISFLSVGTQTADPFGFFDAVQPGKYVHGRKWGGCG